MPGQLCRGGFARVALPCGHGGSRRKRPVAAGLARRFGAAEMVSPRHLGVPHPGEAPPALSSSPRCGRCGGAGWSRRARGTGLARGITSSGVFWGGGVSVAPRRLSCSPAAAAPAAPGVVSASTRIPSTSAAVAPVMAVLPPTPLLSPMSPGVAVRSPLPLSPPPPRSLQRHHPQPLQGHAAQLHQGEAEGEQQVTRVGRSQPLQGWGFFFLGGGGGWDGDRMRCGRR